jgi:protein-S-isoprenylcysteine O-methyltransferase Ste14
MTPTGTAVAYQSASAAASPDKTTATLLDPALAPDAPRWERFKYATFLCASLCAIYTLPYYRSFLRRETVWALLAIFGGQWLGSLVMCLAGHDTLFADRAYWAVKGAIRTAQHFFRMALQANAGLMPEKLNLPAAERVSLLFWLVKVFFIPFMVNVVATQFAVLWPRYSQPDFARQLLTFEGFFFCWIICIEILDTAVAATGYAVESRALGNTVRSVDFTLTGWLAALICYPPFETVTSGYFPLDTSPFISFGSAWLEAGLRAVILTSMTLFACTTLNLGVHFSNLCHRGLVTTGFYAVVRHPAYTFKLITFAAICLAGANPARVLPLIVWAAIYVLRALTEERHLAAVDPAYAEYCRRVRWRFIPGII